MCIRDRSSSNHYGYDLSDESVMELLNCSSDGALCTGCSVKGGHLLATNLVVTNSRLDGLEIYSGNAEMKACSVTGCGENGMTFAGICVGKVTEASVQDCLVKQNRGGGIRAVQKATVTVRGCRSTDNGGAGFRVEDGAQMTVVDSSSDRDAAGCVADSDRCNTVLTMEQVTVDGVVQSGTLSQRLTHRPRFPWG